MCYYDNYKYACADWKWGNFKQHCQKEYRTGETCGTKLIYQTIDLTDKCPFCERIEKKLRRKAKATDDYKRWSREPHKYKASIEKAMADIRQLEIEIQALRTEKDSKYAQIGNPRRAGRAT